MQLIRECGFQFSSPQGLANEYFTPLLDFKAHKRWSHICFVDHDVYRAQDRKKYNIM